MPALFSGNQTEAVALDRTSDNGLRTALGGFRTVECSEYGGNVVAVNYFGSKTFRLEFAAVNFHVVLVHRVVALAQRIDVCNHGEVIEFVMRGKSRRFPDFAFGQFAVAGEHIHARGTFIHARADRQAGAY